MASGGGQLSDQLTLGRHAAAQVATADGQLVTAAAAADRNPLCLSARGEARPGLTGVITVT